MPRPRGLPVAILATASLLACSRIDVTLGRLRSPADTGIRIDAGPRDGAAPDVGPPDGGFDSGLDSGLVDGGDPDVGLVDAGVVCPMTVGTLRRECTHCGGADGGGVELGEIVACSDVPDDDRCFVYETHCVDPGLQLCDRAEPGTLLYERCTLFCEEHRTRTWAMDACMTVPSRDAGP